MKTIRNLAQRLSSPPGQERLTVETLVFAVGFSFVVLSWLALLLTEAERFILPLLLVGILTLTAVVFMYLRRLKGFQLTSRADLVALIFTVAYASLNAALFHDTFYGGRDPGVISNAAAYLSREGTLVIDSYLNHPGWVLMGGSFTVEHLTAYIPWVGIHYLLGGVAGVQFSNFVPLVVALMSTYYVGKRISGTFVGFFAMLAISTTYPMFWFSRGTFNEIFFMALVWFGALCLMVSWQKRNGWFLYPALLSFGLAAHTRPEGVAILVVGLIVVLLLVLRKDTRKLVRWSHLALILLLVANYAYYTALVQPQYFQTHFTGLLRFLSDLISYSPTLNGPVNPDAIRNHFPSLVYAILSAYNLYWPILFVPLALLLGLSTFRRKTSKQLLVVLALVGPTFIYLGVPFITLDQPWFLRRYVATILPMGFLSVGFFLTRCLQNVQLARLILVLVVTLNLATASSVVLHQENSGMIEFAEDLAANFSEDDLILVDRFVTGSYKLADPLYFVYGKYTLWVSSPGELLELVKSAHSGSWPIARVYFVTSVESSFGDIRESVPADGATLVWEGFVAYRTLAPTLDLLHYPGRPPDIYDMSYELARSLVEVPGEIVTRSFNVQVYEIDITSLDLSG